METRQCSAALGSRAGRAWLAALVLSLVGCGGGGSSDTTRDAAPDETPTPTTSLPAELGGRWETVLAYVPPFYSGPYGDIPQGDGSLGVTFTFSPDGRYQHVWDLAQAYFGGNCFRTGHWEEVGTISGDGPEFTFHPGKATYLGMDSCGRAQVLDPAPVTAASHSLKLGQDPSGWPVLRMSFPTGDLLLEKCRRCQ